MAVNAGSSQPVDAGPANGVAVNLAADTVFNPPLRGVWVGTGGTITVDFLTSGTAISLQSVATGYISGRFTKIYSTANGTTASNLVAVW